MNKMKLASLVLVAATICGSITANATAATPHKKGVMCGSYDAISYDCSSLGNKLTIEQIYALGYKVVGMVQMPVSGITRIVIEEQ